MRECLSLAIQHSASPEQAADRFLAEMQSWVDRVLGDYPDGVSSDSHDSGTFMTPWAVYVEATDDSRPVRLMQQHRDKAKAHFETIGQWLDGYWHSQDVHHGTEHFGIFLRTLWTLAPDDEETVRQFEDAAEHIGNWKAGFPKWYDWEHQVFRSFHLGTESIGEPAVNVPDHLRLAALALTAYQMTGKEYYLAFARDYGLRWAEALLARPELPVGLEASGGIHDLGADMGKYRSFAGAAPENLSSDLARTENLIASGAPDVLLKLWKLTSNVSFRQAAARIVDTASTVLDCPAAWQAQAAVRRYRTATSSDRYDQQVRTLSERCMRQLAELTLVPTPEENRYVGLMGMRDDKPDWRDERGNPAPSPLLWALCALVMEEDSSSPGHWTLG